LFALAVLAGASLTRTLASLAAMAVCALVVAWRVPRSRTYLPILLSLVSVMLGWFLADVAPDDRRVLLGLTALCLCEIAVVIAIANVFAAFSSPFLTAMLTLGIVVVGRSADTLARLPSRVFGELIASMARTIAAIVPNLMTYVPARPLLTGEMPGTNLLTYVGHASAMAVGYAIFLLTVSSLLFRRRDFT
jgi:hypothetical protein